MDPDGFLEYEAAVAGRLGGREGPRLPRDQQHPYGVGRFVEAGAWMTAAARINGEVLPKYRSSPNLKHFTHQEDSSSPAPPALIPDRRHLGLSAVPPKALQAPTAMARRNERERKRVRLVNHGFATLRQYLPQGNTRKKLSKMETLRSAIEYIKQLQYLLEPPASTYDQASSHSDDGRWPGMMSEGAAAMSGQVWDDAMAWTTQRSPGSAGSSPHTSLSPDTDLIDFSAFS